MKITIQRHSGSTRRVTIEREWGIINNFISRQTRADKFVETMNNLFNHDFVYEGLELLS